MCHDDWLEVVGQESKCTPLRSAPGHCGLRIEHVVAATRHGQFGTTARDLWSHVLDALLHNALPFSALSRSVLSPVAKPKGGIRPIGVGSLHRRSASRFAARAIHASHGEALRDNHQYGVAENGAHATVCRVVAALQTGYVVLKIDMMNAFNTPLRRSILSTLPRQHPAANLVNALYARETELVVPSANAVIKATRGVTQGDPLGAILFILVLEEARRKAMTDGAASWKSPDQASLK